MDIKKLAAKAGRIHALLETHIKKSDRKKALKMLKDISDEVSRLEEKPRTVTMFEEK